MILDEQEQLERAKEAARLNLDIQKRRELLKEYVKTERDAIKDLEGERSKLLNEVLAGEGDGQAELPLSPETRKAVDRFQDSVNQFAKEGVTVRTKVGDGEWNEHAPQR